MTLTFALNSMAYTDADTAHTYFMNLMQNNYTKALRLSGKVNFDGYCATCVSYQLLALGVNSKYVYGNGNDAYANYSKITKTGGGWTTKPYPGDAYTIGYVLKMADTDSRSTGLYPIVLGFNKGTASDAGQTYGHTLLIYSVQGGKVYFTDSTKPVLSDNIYCIPIEDFITRYSDDPTTAKREFVYDGAVAFYKSAPDRAQVRLLNNPSVSGGKATFWVSAPISTQNCVAIYCDNALWQVIHTDKNTFEVQLPREGSFSAFVTACSIYGSVDSPVMYFGYGPAPSSPYINSNKQVASVGEAIAFSFGATNATSYCIGITHPDGRYEVVQNGTNNTLTRAFYAPGTYTVFVSCCNSVGYADTQPVTVNVY